MKKILYIFLFCGLVFSCRTVEKAKITTKTHIDSTANHSHSIESIIENADEIQIHEVYSDVDLKDENTKEEIQNLSADTNQIGFSDITTPKKKLYSRDITIVKPHTEINTEKIDSSSNKDKTVKIKDEVKKTKSNTNLIIGASVLLSFIVAVLIIAKKFKLF